MNHTNHVPKKEWMAYCVGALGQGMVYAIMSSYISDFYISVLKLTPLFVLLLMLLARVWDAINDPIMGYIMDHANPKNGKMKPYLIYTPIPIAILTVLLFYAPNISDTAKMIYAAVTYVAWGMIYRLGCALLGTAQCLNAQCRRAGRHYQQGAHRQRRRLCRTYRFLYGTGLYSAQVQFVRHGAGKDEVYVHCPVLRHCGQSAVYPGIF